MKDQLEAGDNVSGQAAQAAPAGPPQPAVNFLRAHPELRGQFDQKYGAGATDRILGAEGPHPPIAH